MNLPLVKTLGTILFWVAAGEALVLYVVACVRDYRRKIGRVR